MTMGYDAMAETYARNRGVNSRVFEELKTFCPMAPTSKVLEVGCGTACHVHALVNATGCRGWGLDPSNEMLRRAPTHERLTLLKGVAESIPFEDAFFDLVFSVNVVHHMTKHAEYFKEAVRVLRPEGMICTVTDSTEMIRRREPLSRYWPSSAVADVARYPSVASLLEQMTRLRFVDLATREISLTFSLTDTKPYREKAFSCLHLISRKAFERGLRQMEADLRNGPVRFVSEHVCIWGKVPTSVCTLSARTRAEE